MDNHLLEKIVNIYLSWIYIVYVVYIIVAMYFCILYNKQVHGKIAMIIYTTYTI